MGIVNVTPDSFSDGGLYFSPDAAVEHGLRLVEEGAEVLDVGGESTRPPAYGPRADVDPEEEIRRVGPVIERLAARVSVPLSIDTRKASVARAALSAGATIVNDVTAGRFDSGLLPDAARAGAAVVLMHMRGTDPNAMQDDLAYADLIGEIAAQLAEAAERAKAAGIPSASVAVDPGLGFGKSAGQNLEILRRLGEIAVSGHPVVVGASRKGFVSRFAGPADDPGPARLAGSLAALAVARDGGAAIARVHDVAESAALLAALRRGASPDEAAAAAGADGAAFARMASAIRRPA